MEFSFKNLSAIALTTFALSGCLETLPAPEVPSESATTESQAPSLDDSGAPALNYDGIISKNIQNLLCNSVHHAEAGRLDQAAHKLDVAKNDKLVALLNKQQINSDEYLILDQWLAELTEFLYLDIEQYPSVEQTFPFDCSGKTEQTEAIGEVVELSEEYNVDNANQFLRKVCYSISSSEKGNVLGYTEATAFLGEASIIAGSMLLSDQIDNNHKNELIGWIEQLTSQLITDPANYSDLSTPFNCSLYADEEPNDIIDDIIDGIGGVFGF